MTFIERVVFNVVIYRRAPGFSWRNRFARAIVRGVIRLAEEQAEQELTVEQTGKLLVMFTEWLGRQPAPSKLLLEPIRQANLFLTTEPWMECLRPEARDGSAS